MTSICVFSSSHWRWLPFPSPVHESEKWKWSRSVVSDSSRPHGLQPTRVLCPWDFPGKNTGVGCHCLLLLLLNRFNCVWLCVTPQTTAHQAPLSMEFSRQEYWSGLLPVEHSHVHLLTVYSLWLLQWNSARVEKLQQRANDLQAWNIYYLFLWKVCLPFRGREKIVVCRILGSSLDLLYQLQFSKILRWFIYKIKFEKYYR